MALDQLGQTEQAALASQGQQSFGEKIRNNRLQQAIVHYSIALRVKDDLVPAYFNRGVALARLGETDYAIRDFSEAILRNPKFSAAYYNRGLAFRIQDKPEAAIADFAEALHLRESDVAARKELGSTLIERGDYAHAAEQFATLVEMDQRNAEAHSQLGIALCLQGRHEHAIASFRQALALQPAIGRYYFDLAHALEETGQSDLAAPYYHKGLELDPDYISVAAGTAWVVATHPNQTRRNGIMAIRLASLVCEATNRRRPEFLDILGAAYAEAGRFHDAVGAARQALQLASSSGDRALAERIATRLRLYERNQPYRENTQAKSNRAMP
jgi:tetratricopeptide (TPR) repeat protein